MSECKHGVDCFESRGCYNCLIDENDSIRTEISKLKQELGAAKAQLTEGTGHLEQSVRDLEKRAIQAEEQLCACGEGHFCQSEVEEIRAAADKRAEAAEARVLEMQKYGQDCVEHVAKKLKQAESAAEKLRGEVAAQREALLNADHLLITAERILTRIFKVENVPREDVGLVRSEIWRYIPTIKAALSPDPTRWMERKKAEAKAHALRTAADWFDRTALVTREHVPGALRRMADEELRGEEGRE